MRLAVQKQAMLMAGALALGGGDKAGPVVDYHPNEITQKELDDIKTSIKDEYRQKKQARSIEVQLIKTGTYEAMGIVNYSVRIRRIRDFNIFNGRPIYQVQNISVAASCKINKSHENSDIIWTCE